MTRAAPGQELRLLEALLFATRDPLDEGKLKERLPDGADLAALLAELAAQYEDRGIHLVRVAGKWCFRTAPDLAAKLRIETTVGRKLSRAAVETLATIAYHQPVTRAEIEEIRGVGQSRGTLDVLLEAGWIKPGRKRRTPGRPTTWLTTDAFLDHFGLADLEQLPGADELKAAGLLDPRPALGVLRETSSLPGADEKESDEDGEEAFDASDLQSALLGVEEE